MHLLGTTAKCRLNDETFKQTYSKDVSVIESVNE